jgi:hypothetical protein
MRGRSGGAPAPGTASIVTSRRTEWDGLPPPPVLRYGASRRPVLGVDFSGASDAGKRLWLADAQQDAGMLHIVACQRGDALEGSAPGRASCLSALRRRLVASPAVVGMDFPFGLPSELVEEPSWEEFVLNFPVRYPTPRAFREACRSAAPGELRRLTDTQARTPFSPYNLRLYLQTFYGIGDVLHPLVRQGMASVLPMQRPDADLPWLIEACPASTLKALALYVPYKGSGAERRAARKRIVESIEVVGLWTMSPLARQAAVENPGGDALDSALAALGAFRALSGACLGAPNSAAAVEGHVYF